MSKIIIWNKDNFLIAELDGKIQKEHDYRIVKFKEFKLMIQYIYRDRKNIQKKQKERGRYDEMLARFY